MKFRDVLNKIKPPNIKNVYLRRLSIILHIPVALIWLLLLIAIEIANDIKDIFIMVYNNYIPKAIKNIKLHWNKDYCSETGEINEE